MIAGLESELQRWVDEALPFVRRYEDARAAIAALRGEKYVPHIAVVHPLPEPKAEPPKPEEPEEKRRYTRVTDERVRDWAVGKRRFTRPEMVEELGVSLSTAANKTTKLVERGLFAATRTGVRGSLAFVYVDPKPTPRRTRRAPGTNGGRGNGRGPVPGTGRPAGPAETPGKLKRQQQKARKVHHKPVKGVRL